MTPKKILGILSPRWREPSPCEACGEPFVCGASLTDCWCTEIKLSDSIRAEMRAQYRRCLCRECLERFAAKK